ncbi:unnamed protein product [Dracunculus medinensis]|uniref:7TM_GPCR_Srx domain-containing protein n=1 Tax=Dracunculus medinensis TaxID=318479 RepID=A0A0N4U1V0_DRAME|nr:unnamed protein product [Dracunculus medinensis]
MEVHMSSGNGQWRTTIRYCSYGACDMGSGTQLGIAAMVLAIWTVAYNNSVLQLWCLRPQCKQYAIALDCSFDYFNHII